MAASDDISERLRQAIGTGEIISIRYDGGSRQRTHREILPLQIEGRQVHARCYTSKAVKTFVIDKITVLGAPLSAGDSHPTWGRTAPAAPVPASIALIAAMHQAELSALGWHVEVTTTGDGEYLELYRSTKAGKRLKHPTVVLGYEPLTWDLVVTPDGGYARENLRPRVRPWIIRVSGGASRGSWGSPDKAVEAFLIEAKRDRK